MAIYGRKEKKLRRDITKKQEYQKKFGARIKKGDRDTPSYAEWSKADLVRRAKMRAGMLRRKWKK